MKTREIITQGSLSSKYNEELVESCIHCGSLHLINDKHGNVTCQDCGSENYTELLNIFKWIDVSKAKNTKD